LFTYFYLRSQTIFNFSLTDVGKFQCIFLYFVRKYLLNRHLWWQLKSLCYICCLWRHTAKRNQTILFIFLLVTYYLIIHKQRRGYNMNADKYGKCRQWMHLLVFWIDAACRLHSMWDHTLLIRSWGQWYDIISTYVQCIIAFYLKMHYI
jgi:hypothetical protein